MEQPHPGSPLLAGPEQHRVESGILKCKDAKSSLPEGVLARYRCAELLQSEALVKARSLIIITCGASLGRRIAVVTLLFALTVVVMMVSIFGTTLGSAIVEDQLHGACSIAAWSWGKRSGLFGGRGLNDCWLNVEFS